MNWTGIADVAGLVCLLAGALLCLTASIGLLRLSDLFLRMHAATKPQVLGVLLVLLGIGLRLRDGFDVGTLLLVGVFQLLTIPVSAQMLARAQHRIGASPPEGTPRMDDPGAQPGSAEDRTRP